MITHPPGGPERSGGFVANEGHEEMRIPDYMYGINLKELARAMLILEKAGPQSAREQAELKAVRQEIVLKLIGAGLYVPFDEIDIMQVLRRMIAWAKGKVEAEARRAEFSLGTGNEAWGGDVDGEDGATEADDADQDGEVELGAAERDFFRRLNNPAAIPIEKYLEAIPWRTFPQPDVDPEDRAPLDWETFMSPAFVAVEAIGHVAADGRVDISISKTEQLADIYGRALRTLEFFAIQFGQPTLQLPPNDTNFDFLDIEPDQLYKALNEVHKLFDMVSGLLTQYTFPYTYYKHDKLQRIFAGHGQDDGKIRDLIGRVVELTQIFATMCDDGTISFLNVTEKIRHFSYLLIRTGTMRELLEAKPDFIDEMRRIDAQL